jgi:4-hydroxybenzoate polyprenyltransferase
MLDYLKNVLLETRPVQWIKNLTIFAFLVFSKSFFNGHKFFIVFFAFVAFTLLTSSIYIFNDVIDYESDRANPEKKNRPIASKKISRHDGIVLGVIFFVASMILSAAIGDYLLGMCLLYFILMISYSLLLKNIAIIDALAIAGGFVVRVLAGAFIINVSNIYSWLVIVTICVSLLLAFGKRRAELTLQGSSKAHRKVLDVYPSEMINSLISALVAATFLSYILFTFNTNLTPAGVLLNNTLVKFPSTILRTTHTLKITIPVVFYGIARYLYIIYTSKNGGTPETVLFKDKPLLLTVIVWLALIFLLLYAIK